MKKITYLLFIIFLSMSCFAQNIPFKIQKSEIFKDEYKRSTIVLAEKDIENGFVLVRSYQSGGISPGEGFYIEKYDSNLNLKKEFEYKMSYENYQKYDHVIGVLSFEDGIHFIEIYYDLNSKFLVCKDNVLSNDFKISTKELFHLTKEEMKNLGSFSLQQNYFNHNNQIWNNSNSGNFKQDFDSSMKKDINISTGSEITVVANESKNAFVVVLDIRQVNFKTLKLFLFDNKLNKKIDTVFTKEIKDKNYIFQNIQISQDGNSIFLLAKDFLVDLKKIDVGGKYHFELTKITTEKQKSQYINPKEYFISSLKTIFHNNEIICLGFYSDINDKKNTGYNGICYFKLDSNSLETLNTEFNPFTEQFKTDKYGKTKEKPLKNLSFRNVFFNESNDLIFNAEEETFIASSSGVGIGTGTVSKITYDYDDIVSAKINSEGKLIWARNINKNQTRSDDDNLFISYTSTIKDDKTYFFINASEKIKKISDNRIEFGDTRKNKYNLNIIQINKNGDFDYQKILDEEENEVPFMVSNGIKSGDSVFFLGRKGTKKQLLKVSL